ncbi:uncharacterized protein LOC142337206 [Convolutriloba macropyga]|uniref:uncharacterized protein LOC142337206 n=1 Tax=Convolutriloba macropyga TaxID=536237 RepID=UPI003F528242
MTSKTDTELEPATQPAKMKDEKKSSIRKRHKKLKSSGSFSIEEEEDNLAQISLDQEGLLAEERQELDTFLEAEELETTPETINDSNKLQEPDASRDTASSPNPLSHPNQLVLEKTEEVDAKYITTPQTGPDDKDTTTCSSHDDGENS